MARSTNDSKGAFNKLRAVLPASRPNMDAIKEIRRIANDWLRAGRPFSAGYAYQHAVDLAWGNFDLMVQCYNDSLAAFQKGALDASRPRMERLACLWMWKTELSRNYADIDSAQLSQALKSLDEEIAQLLLEIAETTNQPDAQAGYLVRGFHLTSDLEESFVPEYFPFEIRGMGMGWTNDTVTLTVQSAFQRFVTVSDYEAANTIAESCPDAFTTPGLRGWRAAVQGLLRPIEAVERFDEAAREFSADTQPTRSANMQSWSSINVDLWSAYFRARAHIAEIARSPTRVADLVHEARTVLGPTRSGWSSPQVRCFREVLYVVDEIFSGADADSAAVQAKDAMLQDRRFGWSISNDSAILFFESVAAAFAELQQNPALASISGRLPTVLEALGRINLIGADVAAAIKQGFGEEVTRRLFTGDNTWMYRTIESIDDEIKLQKLLLRLMQAQLPEYAQIRHGPIEHGKDIVALAEIGNRLVLQMYQVKARDITKPIWRQTSPELEEMFQVDMPSLQLPSEPQSIEGILIFNGHFNVYAEPVAEGWREEQARDHNRTFRFMHIDSIVKWVIGNGLPGTLRKALKELDIPII
jgi:hypothetical protein